MGNREQPWVRALA